MKIELGKKNTRKSSTVFEFSLSKKMVKMKDFFNFLSLLHHSFSFYGTFNLIFLSVWIFFFFTFSIKKKVLPTLFSTSTLVSKEYWIWDRFCLKRICVFFFLRERKGKDGRNERERHIDFSVGMGPKLWPLFLASF